MKSILQKSILIKFLLTFLLVITSSVTWSQLSITTANVAVTQNFDGLPSTGTLITPSGGIFSSGWSFLETGANANTTYDSGTGSSATGNTYSFGVAGTNAVTDRALGMLQSGSLSSILGFKFTNNTGTTITSLSIGYAGEVWRRSVAADNLAFSYQLGNASALNTGTWTTVAGLAFTTPVTGTAGVLDGNVPANRTTISAVNITGLSIANGATVTLRWVDASGSSSAGMGIDDFSITLVGAVPPAISSSGTLASLSTVYGTESSNTQFDVSGTNMTAGISINPPAGFQVSTTNDFSSNVGSNGSPITVGFSGTIPNTTIYVRLSSGIAVGNYTGNIVLSSAGATSVNVPTHATNTVNAINLTISGLTANNKTFDNNTMATLSGSPSLVGVLPGDISNVILGGTPVANFNDATVGTGKPVTVSGYTISGSASGNYTLSQPTGLVADILPSALLNQTITFNALSPVTYGDAPFNLTATSDSGLTVSYISSNTSVATVLGNVVTIVGAGTTTITASQAGDSNYNPAANVNQSLVVNPKALTVSGASASSKIYDANVLATITGGSLVGIISPDSVSFSGSGTFDTANVGTSKVVTGALVLSGAQAGNYTLTQPVLSADITVKGLTISGISISNKQYDTTNSAAITGTASLVGVILSDISNVTLAGTPVATFSDAAVGNGKSITVSGYAITGSASGNYVLTQPSGFTANITPKSLAIIGLTANDKVYDRNLSAGLSGTASLSGIILGDEANISLDGTPSATFATFTVGNTKPVSVSGYSISGASLANYTLAPLSLTANITKKDVTIDSALANNKLYDGNTTAVLSGTLNGTISPDVVTINLSGTFADANVGTNKPVTSTSTITGADASNYNLIQPTGLTASITAAPCGVSTGNVVWNFTTASPSSSTVNGISVSNLSQGNNNGTTTLLTTTSASNIYVGASAGNNAGASAFIGALSTSSTYFEFTVTPQAGYNVSLNGMSFGSRSTGTGPQAYTIKSNLDGYSSSLGTGVLTNNSTWGLKTVVLTSSSSVNSGSVTYRIYGHSGAGGAVANTANWRIDDLNLNLAVTPRPALTSALTATTCSGDTFNYVPTTAYTGSTITWTRAAVAGISNAAITTPQTSNPSEILVNTTALPVNVIYEFTVTTSTCYVIQNVTITVNPIFNWYLDADNDGYYIGTVITQCDSPGVGYNNTATVSGDCDDNLILYEDLDGDGFGSTTQVACGVANNSDCDDNQQVYQDLDGDGFGSSIFVDCGGVLNNTDCDDNLLLYEDFDVDGFGNSSVFLACDGVTNGDDCNDNLLTYVDSDGDGFGTIIHAACGPTNDTDCDDNLLQYEDIDGDGFGSSTFVDCGGVTNNSDCDDSQILYLDFDGDGYGSNTVMACGVADATDCNDTNIAIHPGATEICYDGLDNDCDGIIDNGCTPIVTVVSTTQCGSTLTNIDDYVYANIVSGAQGYRFKVTKMIAGVPSTNPADIQSIDRVLRAFRITQLTSYAFNTSYQVEVAVRKFNVWQPFYGSACTISTPATTTAIQSSQCGSTVATMGDIIYANNVPFATGYRFKITDVTNGGAPVIIDRALRDVRLSLLASPQFNTTYSIEVAVKNTDGTYLPYGALCNVTSPSFPTSSLQETGPVNYCDYTATSNAEVIYASSYVGATHYRFRFMSGTTVVYTFDKVLRTFTLSEVPGLTSATTYTVQVAIEIGGIFGPYGKACTLTTSGGARAIETAATVVDFKAVAYPNPFADNFKLDVKTTNEEVIQIRVYDMLGKLVEDKQVEVSEIRNQEVGANYRSGVYNVVVTQGTATQTLRVIKR